MLTREQVIDAIQAKLDAITDANTRAYVNKALVEKLFHLDSDLALARPNPEETMYTQSAFERQVLRRELNNIEPGLGNNLDVVEQYAMLKALHARNTLREGGITPLNSDAGLYDILSR